MIACFNVIGSLSMLILDKKDDVVTLRSLGADDKLISRIFLFEGRLISLFGAVSMGCFRVAFVFHPTGIRNYLIRWWRWYFCCGCLSCECSRLGCATYLCDGSNGRLSFCMVSGAIFE